MIQLKRAELDCFDQIYEDLERQFPPEERKPKTLLAQLIQENRYDLILAYDGTESVGYILLCPTPYGVVWLDYIAVFPEKHSHGYGSQMLRQLGAFYSNFAGCLLEVEQADPAVPNTLRRIRFYESLGCRRYPFYYALPTLEDRLQMDLYLLPFTSDPVGEDSVRYAIRHAFDTIHQDIAHRNEIYRDIAQKMPVHFS